MIFGFIIGFVAASCIAFLSYKKTMFRMRVANAHLRNESDYYFLLHKIAFKELNHHDQEMFNLSPEVQMVKHQYDDNKKHINKGGRY